MSKKVLILSSSPRRGGNSDTLCDEFLRGAQEAGHEVEKIFLKDKTIHFSFLGCGVAAGEGSWPQKDDGRRSYRMMRQRDRAGYAGLFLHHVVWMKTLMGCLWISEIATGILSSRPPKPALRLWNVRSTVFGDSSTVWTIRRRRVSSMVSGPGTRGISKENRL